MGSTKDAPLHFFRHDLAIVESNSVGAGTRIWAFAHVLPGASIGGDCNICDHVFIENDVVIGNRVTIKSGVQVWDGVTLEDDVFVGPNATFTNDAFPRSRQRPERFLRTVVKRRASIGANATILPGLTIGENAMVSAGSVVNRNVPANAVVVGNPARIAAYVDSATQRASLRPSPPPQLETERLESRVNGVVLHRLTQVDDLRGTLVAGEVPREIPFEVRRFFVVFDVTSEEIRGEHAHRTLEQFLICLRGRVNVMTDDGKQREVFTLDSPAIGLYLSPLVWASQYKYSADAMLLVLASDRYRPDDYIRDYAEFLAQRAAKP
jgi:acetyltransferase-like isoleucine patch superfamily enzyme